jgi:hypothetical protein
LVTKDFALLSNFLKKPNAMILFYLKIKINIKDLNYSSLFNFFKHKMSRHYPEPPKLHNTGMMVE